jgi:hypothetical protein
MFDPTLPIDAPQKLALQTRKGGTVENSMNPAPAYAGVELRIAHLKRTYSRALHRPVGPSARYNCHGLTFAARRTGIDKSAYVQRILTEDGYSRLPMSTAPVPGDVVIYREDGDIIHSGIVVEIKDAVTWVLGKWGECHEVVHPVLDCPYKNAAVEFYRLNA